MWNDAIVHVTEQELEKDSSDHSDGRAELLSVAEAIRRSSGKVVVKEMIIGLSSVVQVVEETDFTCSNCGYSDVIKHNPPLFSLPSHMSTAKERRCDSCAQAVHMVLENKKKRDDYSIAR